MCAHMFLVYLWKASGMVCLWTFLTGLGSCKAELFCCSCPFLNQRVRKGVFGLAQCWCSPAPMESVLHPQEGFSQSWASSQRLKFWFLSSWGAPQSNPNMGTAAPSSCSAFLRVNLELCLFCSRVVFGLFQAVFNLSLSQQVWDNLRKNHRRPLKTLDQSVWGKKKREKSAKLFFLYLCLFTKMSFFFFLHYPS